MRKTAIALSLISSSVGVSAQEYDFSKLDWTSNSYTSHKVGPAPRSNPPEALATPTLGAEPTSHGFAFDINSTTVAWRWGGSIVKKSGDSGLEMHCSEDDNATFKKATFSNGKATIPCSGNYSYFFRYEHPHSLNDNPAHRWIYTGLFTTKGKRVDPHNYPKFTDGSSNWMRYRHPLTNDGITAAILDRPNAGERLRSLDRYLVWVNDSGGNVDFEFEIEYMSDDEYQGDNSPGFRRNEAMRNSSGGPNGQQFFAINTGGATNGDGVPKEELEGFGNAFSYGQTISYEVSVEAAGKTSAQTYNDFSHYVVGCGFCGKYGDPRLNPAGKATTSQVFSDKGAYSHLEYNAIFTQPMVTIHKEDMVDDFILGHHLFHGVDPNKKPSEMPQPYQPFDDPDVQIGEKTCGNCHFRDGRGSEVVETPDGPRIAPPIYGVKLLEAIKGREVGFGWQGKEKTVASQVKAALVNDHKVNPDDLPGRVLELLTTYTEVITVPARDPGSYDKPGVSEGDQLFNKIGCADCHTPVQRTRSSAETHLRDLVIRPYTDMKTWDLGEGDFRTPALWGLGHNIDLLERNQRQVLFWHDGSATSVKDAILKHGGDGKKARDAFKDLSSQEQTNIANFIRTL